MNNTELIAETAKARQLIGLRHGPLAFFYTDREPAGYRPQPGGHCLFGVLTRARRGETVYFDAETTGCGGGTYYLGFCPPRPGIAEFVSSGIPGKMEGEHYKKSPDLVQSHLDRHAVPPAPARYAVFMPVSSLQEADVPLVIICFASPDELAGLVGLAGYDRAEDAVIAPFGSGCSAIVTYPLEEAQRDLPRAVLGGFDPSARPFFGADELSFAVPITMWKGMIANAGESFLTTPTWAKIHKRLGQVAVKGGV